MRRVAIISALTALTALTATATADTPLDLGGGDDIVALQEKKQAASADVIVLFASNAGTGIDDCAAHLKALKQPPLSSYDSYSCLSSKKLALELKGDASMVTPDKGKLSLHLNEVVERENKKPKYNVDVQIDKADGDKYVSTNVKAPEGKYFFLAGQKYKNGEVEGVLVFAIRMQAP